MTMKIKNTIWSRLLLASILGVLVQIISFAGLFVSVMLESILYLFFLGILVAPVVLIYLASMNNVHLWGWLMNLEKGSTIIFYSANIILWILLIWGVVEMVRWIRKRIKK